MVRVISVHHFTKQDVSSIERTGERGVSSGKEDCVFIGGEHQITVRNLKKGGEVKHSFSTVDLVQQLVYCEIVDYVCTLETKPARHGGDHTYVRVYLNWENDTSNQPMRARIAGRVTPSSQSGTVNSLEMVEIPLKKPAVFIACCQTTGNIAIASGMNISIFKFNMKTHDISKQKFMDFDEMFELDLSFVIREVAISEDLIGCLSEIEAHVFQLTVNSELLKQGGSEGKLKFMNIDDNAEKSASKSQSKSPSRSTSSSRLRGKKVTLKEESLSSVRVSDNYFDLSELEWAPTLSYGQKKSNDDSRFLLFPSLVGAAQCGQIQEPGEIIGPICSTKCSNVKVKLVVKENAGQKYTSGIFEAVTLVHKRIDALSDPDLPFSDIKLISVYDSDKTSTSTRRVSNFFLPYSNRVGVSIFTTTPHVGYLYHVTLNNEPFDTTVVKGGVFSYTAPVQRVVLEPSLLHALTQTGLETYTLRPHPHIITSHFPEGLSMIVPAHWEESVCLVGLRPFLNVENLALTDSCLALITANEETGDKSHTLYSLHLPSSVSLYKEMIRVGKTHRTASPATYLHLLLESHFVLTTALHYDPTSESSEKEDLFTILQDSSALLGDYYSTCNTEGEWDQAVQYYQASGLTPDEIIERGEEETNGLVYIITALLLHPSTPALSEAQCHCILETFEKKAPEKVAPIILQSTCFRDFKKDKAMTILKQQLAISPDPRPVDVLCVAITLLNRNFNELVPTVFSLLRPHQLVEELLKYPSYLFKKENGKLHLTELSMMLVEHKQEVFMMTFVSLIGDGVMSLDAFVDAYVEVYPIVSCGPECNVNSLRLRSFFESFFMEYVQCKEMMESREKYSIAVTALVSLYLASLIGGFHLEETEEGLDEARISFIDLYTERPGYLNHLPPFIGIPPDMNCRKPKDDETCNCCLCCLHLLLLQSLLASDIPSSEDRANVLKFINVNKTIVGADSLRVLCLEKKDQFSFLLQNYSSLVMQFCTDSFESPEEWREAVQELNRLMSYYEETGDTEKFGENQKILHELLDHLVLTTSFDVFLNIVPRKCHKDIEDRIRQSHSVALGLYVKQNFTTYANNVFNHTFKSAS